MLNNNKEIGNDKKEVKHTKDTQRDLKEEHNYKEMKMTTKRKKTRAKIYKIRIERCDATTKTRTTKRYKATNSK